MRILLRTTASNESIARRTEEQNKILLMKVAALEEHVVDLTKQVRALSGGLTDHQKGTLSPSLKYTLQYH